MLKGETANKIKTKQQKKSRVKLSQLTNPVIMTIRLEKACKKKT